MIQLFMVYLATGVVVLVGALAFAGLVSLSGSLARSRPEGWLRWGLALLLLALLLPALARAGGWGRGRPAPVEMWTGSSPTAMRALVPGRLTVRVEPAAGLPAQLTLQGWMVGGPLTLVTVGLLLAGSHLVRRQRQLRRLCARLPVIKAVGRVRLCAADHAEVGTPFAARAGALAYIVVPSALLADSTRLRLVIAHEAHHHRRGDLYTTRALAVLRALFFWNPALALWQRALAELQDRCCDQQVLRRMGVSGMDYARCLLWAAEQARGPVYLPVGARAMASPAAETLKRRIQMLQQPMRRGLGVSDHLLGTACLTLVLGTAWAACTTVADRRVDKEEVAAVAARLQARSGFPLIADQRIVDVLNRQLANPNWRERMKLGLSRMPAYRPMMESVLREQGLPVELLAMVLIESAFDKDAKTSRPVERRSVGIWQIMPATGRSLGLAVTPELDERLDPRKATEAAARYLRKLHDEFQDWPLAVAGYNAGEARLRTLAAGLQPKQVQDRLLASDAEYGRYLASFTIAALLIEEPSLLGM